MGFDNRNRHGRGGGYSSPAILAIIGGAVLIPLSLLAASAGFFGDTTQHGPDRDIGDRVSAHIRVDHGMEIPKFGSEEYVKVFSQITLGGKFTTSNGKTVHTPHIDASTATDATEAVNITPLTCDQLFDVIQEIDSTVYRDGRHVPANASDIPLLLYENMISKAFYTRCNFVGGKGDGPFRMK